MLINKKAITVSASGDIEEITSTWTSQEMNEAVGGFFDVVRFGNLRFVAYINDEGKLIDLPENKIATALWYDSGEKILLGDYIAGDVVFIGDVDEEGYDTSVPNTLIQLILQYKEKLKL